MILSILKVMVFVKTFQHIAMHIVYHDISCFAFSLPIFASIVIVAT